MRLTEMSGYRQVLEGSVVFQSLLPGDLDHVIASGLLFEIAGEGDRRVLVLHALPEDFVQAIEQRVSQCTAFLALLGREWLERGSAAVIAGLRQSGQ